MIWIRRRPNAFLESVNRQLSAVQYAVLHDEARTAPLACLALHRYLLIEPAWQQEFCALFDQWHPNDAVSAPHFGGGKTGARKQLPGR